MTAKPPPAPPANRSPKGTGDDKTPPAKTGPSPGRRNENPDEKGRGANIAQNTTNQGHQQDR